MTSPGQDPVTISGLWSAARRGDERSVEQLLESGVDVNGLRFNVEGSTPLHAAALEGHEGVAEQLLKAGADVSKIDTDYGATPLHWATLRGNKTMVLRLLKAGADVNEGAAGRQPTFSPPPEEPLFPKRQRIDLRGATPLLIAAEEGHGGLVKELLKAGAHVNKATVNFGSTPLYVSAEEGHEAVVDQLLNAGADVNKPTTRHSSTGICPLHAAARSGNEGVVEKLLKSGAEVNNALDNGTTPLYLAALHGHEGIVDLLLKAGADLNTVTPDYGTTRVFSVAKNRQRAMHRPKEYPLHAAAGRGHEGVVKRLLKSGAEVNMGALGNGTTPLHIAVLCGQEGIVDLLLKAGADLNTATDEGTTPVFSAAKNGNEGVVHRLLKAGADVSKARTNGATPLHAASSKGHCRVCSLLLEAGASVHPPMRRRNGRPCSALKLAVSGGHREVALVLMRHGASSSNKILKRSELQDLTEWMAEELQEKDRVIAENNRQMEQMVEGIPEWCAQAASSAAAASRRNDISNTGAPSLPLVCRIFCRCVGGEA